MSFYDAKLGSFGSKGYKTNNYVEPKVSNYATSRGALIYGGVHLGLDNSTNSSLKIGYPVPSIILDPSDGSIKATSLALTEDLEINNIKVKKCLYTTIDSGTDNIVEICKNKIINNNATDFDDIYFYVEFQP